MTASGLDEDLTVLDVATLNRYFRDYYLAYGQGGTHTLQRNLIQLFKLPRARALLREPYSAGGREGGRRSDARSGGQRSGRWQPQDAASFRDRTAREHSRGRIPVRRPRASATERGSGIEGCGNA
jgi:hypothetical protein